MCERRDQADDGAWYPDRDGDQVGAGEWRGGGEPVEATAHLFELTAVAKSV